MAYNGAGIFSRLYNFVVDRDANVPITASRMDAEMDGFATGLTTALTKDGQTTATARIPFASGIGLGDGTVALPAVNFTADTDSGVYRIGANNIGVAVNAAKVLDVSTTGLAVTGTFSSTSTIGTGAQTITSASANALAVGLAGTTNPALNVDASTASSATGIDIKSAAAAGGVAIKVLSSGTNEALTINAKGSGTIGIGSVSTGAVTITPALTGGSTINATTGFKVNGSATSTNYLRGDGTNFISSAIQAGDLPLATNAAIGGMRGDGTTISCTSGVCTGIDAVGTTAVTGGTSGYLLYNNGGTLGNETIASILTAGTGIAISGTTNATIATSLTVVSNALTGDVALNSTASYFDGPSAAQGTSGVWFCTGTVTLLNASNNDAYAVRLTDGTSVFASTQTSQASSNSPVVATLSAVFNSPAGNIKIQVKPLVSTTGNIKYNLSGESKDSVIYCQRIG